MAVVVKPVKHLDAEAGEIRGVSDEPPLPLPLRVPRSCVPTRSGRNLPAGTTTETQSSQGAALLDPRRDVLPAKLHTTFLHDSK